MELLWPLLTAYCMPPPTWPTQAELSPKCPHTEIVLLMPVFFSGIPSLGSTQAFRPWSPWKVQFLWHKRIWEQLHADLQRIGFGLICGRTHHNLDVAQANCEWCRVWIHRWEEHLLALGKLVMQQLQGWRLIPVHGCCNTQGSVAVVRWLITMSCLAHGELMHSLGDLLLPAVAVNTHLAEVLVKAVAGGPWK